MRGIVVGEVSNASANPIVFFPHQVRGLMTDLSDLTFRVIDHTVATPTDKIAETTMNLAVVTSGGTKVTTGRYAPTIDTAGWATGTYEVRWRWKAVSTDAFKTARQWFEVLDAAEFAYGNEFFTYATTKQLKGWGFAQTIGVLQRLALDASVRIELLTARFFEPRYMSMDLTGRGNPALTPSHPIIGIESIAIEPIGVGSLPAPTPIDTEAFQVFNRHLDGVLDPDDRDNPRVELLAPLADVFTAIYWSDRKFVFPEGPRNIRAPGVYGYTDPDGTPFGRTPPALARVVAAFVGEGATVPAVAGGGGGGVGGGIIRSARTRDQSITYASAADGGVGPLTGNRTIDDVLVPLMRPTGIGAA